MTQETPQQPTVMTAEELACRMFDCAYVCVGTSSMDFMYGEAHNIIKQRDAAIARQAREQGKSEAYETHRKWLQPLGKLIPVYEPVNLLTFEDDSNDAIIDAAIRYIPMIREQAIRECADIVTHGPFAGTRGDDVANILSLLTQTAEVT